MKSRPRLDLIASAGGGTVTKIIASVPVDQEFGNHDQVRRLLQEPIKNTEALLGRGPIDIANGSGKSYCSQFATVINKYPFDPNLIPMPRRTHLWNSSTRFSGRRAMRGRS